MDLRGEGSAEEEGVEREAQPFVGCRHAADPKSVEWNEWMAREFQAPSPHAKEGQWWAPMELAFDLKGALGEPTH